MLKFLPGIILIQLVTAGLSYTAFNKSDEPQLTIVVLGLSLLVSILAGFWFASIARDMHKTEQAKMQQQHARDREELLVRAEREKADFASESYKQINKETRKAHARANFKVGAAFTLAAGAGALMIFTQLITVGMMVLVASGSGLAGYLARARHERISKIKDIGEDGALLIENQIKTAKKPK